MLQQGRDHDDPPASLINGAHSNVTNRSASARIVVEVVEPATVVMQVAVALGHVADESLEASVAGRPVPMRHLVGEHDTRLHVVDATTGVVVLEYSARVAGRGVPDEATETDLLRYLRPSRYCESDSLAPTARAEFAGLAGADLLAAVSSWVGTRLVYVPGSSLPTDGAVRTLLARQGVCRDYAHLVVALLRARNVPARVVSVYAPGLDPMDFHAVAEAHIDGDWRVVDATTLAPRGSLLRIATGRDASDTAFLSSYGGRVLLREVQVTAVADSLPCDDVHTLMRLS
jgi:transglutaminase-like putative cysteine protease